MRWIIFSVKGMVWSADRKILLLKRALQDRYCPGRWELPGGKVETWNLKENIIREIEEETGIGVTAIAWEGIWLKKSVLYKAIFGWSSWRGTLFCRCRPQNIYGCNIRLSGEHVRYGWLELERAKFLALTPETRYAIEYLARD